MRLHLKNIPATSLLGAFLVIASIAMAIDNKARKTAARKADSTTALHVKQALMNELGTRSDGIEVRSANGDVTLTGTVDQRETMRLATGVARSIHGVGGVDNEVRLASEPGMSRFRPLAVVVTPDAPEG